MILFKYKSGQKTHKNKRKRKENERIKEIHTQWNIKSYKREEKEVNCSVLIVLFVFKAFDAHSVIVGYSIL